MHSSVRLALAPVVLALACGHREREGAVNATRHVRPLGRPQLEQLHPGMTLSQAMGILGPRAEINPVPAPVPHLDTEVLVLWRDGPETWIAVLFVPDKDRVLRVPGGTTFAGSRGL